MRRFLVLVVLLGSSVSAHSYYFADSFEEANPVSNGYDSGGNKAHTWQKDDKLGQLRGSAMISSADVDDKGTSSTSEKASESLPTVNQVSSVIVPWGSGISTKTQKDDHKANAEGDTYKATTTSNTVKEQPVLGNSKPQFSTDASGQVMKAPTLSNVNESQAIVPRDANKTSTANATISREERINSTSENMISPYKDKLNSSPVNKTDRSTPDSVSSELKHGLDVSSSAFKSLSNFTDGAITSPIERNESFNGSVYHAPMKRESGPGDGDIRSDVQKNQEKQQPGDRSGTRDTNLTLHELEKHPVAPSGGVEAVIVPWRRGTLDSKLEAKDFGNADKRGNGGVGAEISSKKDEKQDYGAVLHDTKTENAKEKPRLPSSPESNSSSDKTSDLYDPKNSSTSKETTGSRLADSPTERNGYPSSEDVKQGENVNIPWENRASRPSDSKAHASEPTHNDTAGGGEWGRPNYGKPQLTRDYTVNKPHVLDNVVPWNGQYSLIARGLQSEPEDQKSGEYPAGESNEHARAAEENQQPVEANGAKGAEEPGVQAAPKDEGQQTGEHPVVESSQQTAVSEEHQPVTSSSEPRVEGPSDNTAAKEHTVEESGGHTEGEKEPVNSNGGKESAATKDENQNPAEQTGGQSIEVSSEVKHEDQQPAEQTVGVSGESTQVQEEGGRQSEQPIGNATEVKDGVMTTMNVSEENVRWDQDDCDPCEVPTLPPTLAPIYPRGEDDYMKYLPNVSETTESWKDLTENLPPKPPTKTPNTRSPPRDEFIHCTKIIGNYGEIYECTTNNTALPTPAPTQPQPGKTCIDVSVEGDATYCIEGPICSGSDSLPAGYLCPIKGDVAVKDCWGDKLPSWTSAGTCVAPVNATCARIKTGAWGCVFGEPSKATGSPATEKPTETPSGTPAVTEAPPEIPTPAPTAPKTEAPESPHETAPAPTVPRMEAPTKPPYEATPGPTVPKTENPPGAHEVTPSPTVPRTAIPGPTPALTKASDPQKSTPAPSRPYDATPSPTKFSSPPTPTPAVTTTRDGTTYPTTTGTTKPATSPTTTPEATTSTPGTSTGADAYANTGASAADANSAIGASTSKGNTSTSASGLDKGAIAGIIIACVVFAAFIVVAVLYKQRSIARQREENLFADLSATGARPLETDYAAM